MFIFGDARQLADSYVDSAVAGDGPDIPDVPFEELSKEDQLVAFTYIYSAYKAALIDEIDSDAIATLMKDYDDMFMKLVKAQPDFAERVGQNRHRFLPDYTAGTVNKYRMMAGLPPIR